MVIGRGLAELLLVNQKAVIRAVPLTAGFEQSRCRQSYTFSPAFKISYKITGTRTNRTGDWKTDFRERSLKPVYLHPIMPFGIKARFALGSE